MKRLCLGGSFNPIHYGHLRCAAAVAETCGFDRVVLIPSSQPPHKQSADLAPADDRLAMCRLVAERDPLFEVNDLELRRSGPSYTFDTVKQLQAAGWGRVSWMIGADMLLYLPKWYRAEELLEEVDFLVVARPGWVIDWSGLPTAFQKLSQRVVEAPLVEISATDIRRRVRAGESIEKLTPPAVVQYITHRGLYR